MNSGNLLWVSLRIDAIFSDNKPESENRLDIPSDLDKIRTLQKYSKMCIVLFPSTICILYISRNGLDEKRTRECGKLFRVSFTMVKSSIFDGSGRREFQLHTGDTKPGYLDEHSFRKLSWP